MSWNIQVLKFSVSFPEALTVLKSFYQSQYINNAQKQFSLHFKTPTILTCSVRSYAAGLLLCNT